MKVLLDANFLIDVVRFKAVLEEISSLLQEPYTFATLDSVIQELTKISSRRIRAAGYAKLALTMMDTYDIEVLKSRKQTDDAIIDLAKNKKVIVATNDTKLRKRLRTVGRKAIYLKSKKHLALG